MRVALDARYLDGKGSGIGSYTYNLAHALLEEDPSLELLLVRGLAAPPSGLDGSRVEEVRFPFPPNTPATRYLLGPVLARQRFDLFHAPFAVVPRGLNRPMVVTVHDLMWIVNPRFNSTNALHRIFVGGFFRLNLEAAMSEARRILTVSEASRHAIEDHVPWFAGKIRVTENGVDDRTFSPRTGTGDEAGSGRVDPSEADPDRVLSNLFPPRTPFVLTIGDASPHKNHANAVRGFLEAFASRPEYRMVLVRRFLRRDPEISKLLSSERARGRVLALPHVPRETLDALLRAARIYLHPSYYEGFGIPILEAMVAGTPVVTSTTSCLPEVAGEAALLVDPADPSAIARALTRLDSDEALRARLVSAGRGRVACYTWKRCARLTLEVYREIEGGGSTTEEARRGP